MDIGSLGESFLQPSYLSGLSALLIGRGVSFTSFMALLYIDCASSSLLQPSDAVKYSSWLAQSDNGLDAILGSGEAAPLVIRSVPKPSPPSWLKPTGVDLPSSDNARAVLRDSASAIRSDNGDDLGRSGL